MPQIRMSIILIRGFSHSGKDFVGNILCNNHNYKRVAFADSLKNIVSKQFNCPLDLLHSQEGKLNICATDSFKRTYRQILIDEALRLRNMDPDIFAKYCCEEIKLLNHDKFVITDWRYENELDIIKDKFPIYNITTVHLQRSNQIQSPINDISEYQLTNRTNDYILENKMDTTIYDEVNKLINYISSVTTSIK